MVMVKIPPVWWSPSEERFLGPNAVFLPEDSIRLVPERRSSEPPAWTEADFDRLAAEEPAPTDQDEHRNMAGGVRTWHWADGRKRAWRETAEPGVWREAKV